MIYFVKSPAPNTGIPTTEIQKRGVHVRTCRDTPIRDYYISCS